MNLKTKELDNAEIMRRIAGYHNLKVEKATAIVKKFPFLYTALLLILAPFEVWMSLKWSEALGLLVFTSVPSMWLCWKLYKILKMCPWHRTQCFVTLLPIMIPLCRIFNPELNVAWVWSGISIILIVSLVNCYKTFIRPTRRG